MWTEQVLTDSLLYVVSIGTSVCSFIIAFVMACFFKLTKKVGSNLMRTYFLLHSLFLIALGFYLYDPNAVYLILVFVVCFAGMVQSIFMFKNIYLYFRKKGIKVVTEDFFDLGILTAMFMAVKVRKQKVKIKPNAIPEFRSKKIDCIKGEILHSLPENSVIYLDNEKKVKATKLPIKFVGSFFLTEAKPNGKINGHFHDLAEYCRVLSGELVLVIILDKESDLTRTVIYRAGDTFRLSAGTVHEVHTSIGYKLEVYFPKY